MNRPYEGEDLNDCADRVYAESVQREIDEKAAQEFAEADLELQQLLWLSLDRCFAAGAREDDLKLLAWQCGLNQWSPKHAA